MARKGLVVVLVHTDETVGLPSKPPTVVSSGFIEDADHANIMSRASETVYELIASRSVSSEAWLNLEADILRVLTRFFSNETRRRPFIRIIKA